MYLTSSIGSNTKKNLFETIENKEKNQIIIINKGLRFTISYIKIYFNYFFDSFLSAKL